MAARDTANSGSSRADVFEIGAGPQTSLCNRLREWRKRRTTAMRLDITQQVHVQLIPPTPTKNLIFDGRYGEALEHWGTGVPAQGWHW